MENNNLYFFGDFKVEARERLLSRNGEFVPLGGRTFDLLLVLLQSAGRLKSRDELIETLWPTTIVEEANLNWHVNTLRKALGDTGPTWRYLKTVRGHGYRFIAPVTVGDTSTNADSPESESGRPSRIGAGGAGRRPRPYTLIVFSVAVVAAIFVAGYFTFWHSPTKAGASPSPDSIAVLPFENLSPNGNDVYLARGIQDTILTKLAGIRSLHVVSRTSADQYPSRPQNLKTVARELGVATLLEGSVQKANNQILINVQLINARTDEHIWAESYTRTLNNVFGVENDVAREVAVALKLQLVPEESRRLAAVPTANPQAYDDFLRAEYFISQVGSPGNKTPAKATAKAERYYKQAIALDPNFALAQARLSRLYSYTYWFGLNHTKARIESAENAAERALALAPDLAQAHTAMGYVYYWGHRNYAAALKEFERARRVLPNNVSVIGAIAYIHRRQGKWKAMIEGFRKAEALDPRNPNWPTELGIGLTQLRHYAQAKQQFDRALAVKPGSYYPLLRKACALLLSGKLRETRAALSRMPHGLGKMPREDVLGTRFETAMLSHDPDKALALLAAATGPWIGVPFTAGRIPVSLLRAQALSLKGDQTQARKQFETARSLLESALKRHLNGPKILSPLALALAGLDNKALAIQFALRANQLLPASKDALAGPSHFLDLARVYAQTGETAKAIKILAKLLGMPAGLYLSVPLLRLDPAWNPIRKAPGFQALLRGDETQPAPAATLTANAGAAL